MTITMTITKTRLVEENFLCCALKGGPRNACKSILVRFYFERFLTFLKVDIEEVPRGAMEETDGQHPRAAREVEAA